MLTYYKVDHFLLVQYFGKYCDGKFCIMYSLMDCRSDCSKSISKNDKLSFLISLCLNSTSLNFYLVYFKG